ncbi:MAG: hypothetical protein LBJ00_01125 [Planctomycetaceae bacterium]|nr:hypothetical protein [Planctomycetaceae bacterium]
MNNRFVSLRLYSVAELLKYIQVTLKFMWLNTQLQQREAVVCGQSLPPVPVSV